MKLLNEKPAFIHTTCRTIIDLRKSEAQAMLQSTLFPEAPVPTCTIADILQLQQMQSFDFIDDDTGKPLEHDLAIQARRTEIEFFRKTRV